MSKKQKIQNICDDCIMCNTCLQYYLDCVCDGSPNLKNSRYDDSID